MTYVRTLELSNAILIAVSTLLLWITWKVFLKPNVLPNLPIIRLKYGNSLRSLGRTISLSIFIINYNVPYRQVT